MKNIFFCLTFLLFFSNSTFAIFEVNHIAPQSESDMRMQYDKEVLKLALEKTKEEFGPYKISDAGKFNYKRAEVLLENNQIKNLIYKQSVSKERIEKFGAVPFPVDLGIVGYRIFLHSKKISKKLVKIKSLEDLKGFSIGQGQGWLDTSILRESGFEVEVGSTYSGLFRMVARGNFDLFPRGANEILNEWNANSKVLPKLDYEKNFVLYYPLPRFFITNKGNKILLKRVEKGLKMAFKDGSLLTLWKKNYSKSVEFVDLKSRIVFKIENPFLKGIDRGFEKYILDPSEM
jgi:hypothetical protein